MKSLFAKSLLLVMLPVIAALCLASYAQAGSTKSVYITFDCPGTKQVSIPGGYQPSKAKVNLGVAGMTWFDVKVSVGRASANLTFPSNTSATLSLGGGYSSSIPVSVSAVEGISIALGVEIIFVKD